MLRERYFFRKVGLLGRDGGSSFGRDAVRPLPPVGDPGDDRPEGAVIHSKSAQFLCPSPCGHPICNQLPAPCSLVHKVP